MSYDQGYIKTYHFGTEDAAVAGIDFGVPQ